MRVINVTAFVDWTAQIHNAGAKRISDPLKRASITLESVAKVIANGLKEVDPSSRFAVRLRLYHGWHRGLTPTDNRRALLDLENNPDFQFPYFTNIRFDLPIGYGENLLNALPHRKRKKAPLINLPDTLRPSMENPGEVREKMVDSALVCDVLTHARFDPEEWRIVLAEDDDLVPALYVSEAWSKDKGGRTMLLRRRGQSKHLSLDGLIKEYAS